MLIPFKKMHGLGNDFVVLDRRDGSWPIGSDHVRFLADRRHGIGCDQVMVIEKPRSKLADIALRIFNPDGSQAGACGNGTRCVASLFLTDGKDHLLIETEGGLLDAEISSTGIAVDMGSVKLDWRDIPLSRECDTGHLPVKVGPLDDGVAVNVGNPHAVFFVDRVEEFDLAYWGPQLERHPLFPEHANIEIVSLLGKDEVRMRVWERGAGITPACGSGACAAAVAAHLRGFTGRKVGVYLDGGRLDIEWGRDGHAIMTGPVALSFTGQIELPA